MSFFNIVNGFCNGINNVSNNDKKLSDLPVFRYRKVDKIKCKSCSICLEYYKEGDFIPYFKCGHYLHYNCFKKCLLYKNENFDCPICRQEIMKQSFVDEAKQKRKSFLDRTHSL
jgi:C4-type Zn-finger protein